MVVNINENLKSLGFSDYEARVYLELVQRQPVSAYEAAKGAGVPSSKVYEVLARLKDRGLVLELGEPDKRLYGALDPQELLLREKSRHRQVLDRLASGFDQLSQAPRASWLWNLGTFEELTERARLLLEEARSTLLLSVWEEDLDWVHAHWNRARDRGLRSALVLFGEGEIPPLGQVYRHPIRDTLYQERGGRAFVLVVDGNQVLWGNQGPAGLEAVWSRNPGFVTLAEDYIKHDIYIMKLVARYGPDMLERFGSGYAALRNVYEDKEASP